MSKRFNAMEWVVVVAIIVVLISLLVPSIQQAKTSYETAQLQRWRAQMMKRTVPTPIPFHVPPKSQEMLLVIILVVQDQEENNEAKFVVLVFIIEHKAFNDRPALHWEML